MIRYSILTILLIATSCTQFVQLTDDEYYEEIDTGSSSHFNIVFSHNINAETNPCGCRQFPLGGMSQVNGILKSEESKSPTIYVDTGDTFFETTVIPKFIAKSSEFKAHKIAEGLDLLGLKLFTPGDQDFSMGETFLVNISKKHNFKFLISNSSKAMKIKHQKLARIDTKGLSLFFIGVILPDLLKPQFRHLVISPIEAIKKQINLINKNFSKLKNKRIVIMSHSGVEFDKRIAKSFPEVDWIIGAHSQSFLRYSIDENNAQLVQVLSRNHHLGHISLPLTKGSKESYKLIEVRDETKDLIKNNKMIKWVDTYKSELDKVSLAEQQSDLSFPSEKKIATYISCSDCHTKQVDFWQGTAHSLAYTTLVKAKSANNTSCVKCHSVGFNQEGGFFSTSKIAVSEHKDFNIDTYWKEFSKNSGQKHPVREQSTKHRKKVAKKWLKSDIKHKITDNFSNVQCLNCHNTVQEHPFGESSPKSTHKYQSKCMECHTRDQSPEWYNKDAKGLATSPNQKYFSKKIKEVSCPKIETN